MSRDVWERWLGVGLSGTLGAITLVLALSGQLHLYLNPANAGFAIVMAVVALVVAVLGWAIPLGAESDHDHDHDHAAASPPEEGAAPREPVRPGRRPRSHPVAVITGAVATAVVLGAWALPPATLSVDLAMERSAGSPALFGATDAVELVSSGDTSQFGIPDWSAVFAGATSPEQFAGDAVTLTGFVTPFPEHDGTFLLTRMVITHCVIDAQPASVPVQELADGERPPTGQWVTVEGTVVLDGDELRVRPTTIAVVDEPGDPYEY